MAENKESANIAPKKHPGRPRGSPNKLTSEARAVFQKILDRQAPNAERWLEETAAEDPGRALDLLLKLSRYFIPELNRTEVTGADGEKLTIEIRRYEVPAYTVDSSTSSSTDKESTDGNLDR